MRWRGGCGRSASSSAAYDVAAAMSSSSLAAGRCAFQTTSAACPELDSCVEAAFDPDAPAVDVVQRDLRGIGRLGLEIARPRGPAPVAIGCHDAGSSVRTKICPCAPFQLTPRGMHSHVQRAIKNEIRLFVLRHGTNDFYNRTLSKFTGICGNFGDGDSEGEIKRNSRFATISVRNCLHMAFESAETQTKTIADTNVTPPTQNWKIPQGVIF